LCSPAIPFAVQFCSTRSHHICKLLTINYLLLSQGCIGGPVSK
jgi:hypothetical protein